MINLLEEAKRAIEELFSDKSVSLETALENMEILRDEIEMYIDAIKGDIRRRDE